MKIKDKEKVISTIITTCIQNGMITKVTSELIPPNIPKGETVNVSIDTKRIVAILIDFENNSVSLTSVPFQSTSHLIRNVNAN